MSNGLSLLEFIIVISLMATMLLSSVAAYRTFIEKNQLTSIVNNLISALQFARFTAMTSQRTITFCAQGVDNQCGSNWQRGQIILDEKNETVLRYVDVLSSGYQLLWKSTLGESDALRFRANGFTRGQQGSFLICNKTKPHAPSARIVILRTGRLRSVVGKIVGC